MHCHSTASDGEFPPEAVVIRAHEVRLSAIALTDHDTTAGVEVATEEAAELGLRVVAGCEFSVKAPWGEMHVLGYFLGIHNGKLQDFLAHCRQARLTRAEQMLQKLSGLGIEIGLDEVSNSAAGGSVGRPHVARALIRHGAAIGFNDAFNKYIGGGRTAYVPKQLPTLHVVSELIHSVGGIVVAAHLGPRAKEGVLRGFIKSGLDGIEVRHPTHRPEVEAKLIAIASRLGLVISGGSDWHGEGLRNGSHAPLGAMEVPEDWLRSLEGRRLELASQRSVSEM